MRSRFRLPPIPPPNRIFEIIPQYEGEIPDIDVKFKGNPFPSGVLVTMGDAFIVNMPPEEFLDFKAVFFPPGFRGILSLPKKKCLDFHATTSMERIGRKLELCFSFFEEDMPDGENLNSYSMLNEFRRRVEKAGYVTEWDANERGREYAVHVNVLIPLTDYVFEYYQKHLPVFEEMFRQLEKECLGVPNVN